MNSKRYLQIFVALAIGTVLAIVITKQIDKDPRVPPLEPQKVSEAGVDGDNTDDSRKREIVPTFKKAADPAVAPQTGTPVSQQTFDRRGNRFLVSQFNQQSFDSRNGVPATIREQIDLE